MIYLDTSVALPHLLAEDETPPDELWRETLVSSRLFEYEIWTRIRARNLAATHTQAAQALLSRVAFLELIGEVLARARAPFPVPVRTLDTPHLASLQFPQEQDQPIQLATYDRRVVDAAVEAGVPLYPL